MQHRHNLSPPAAMCQPKSFLLHLDEVGHGDEAAAALVPGGNDGVPHNFQTTHQLLIVYMLVGTAPG